MSSHTGTADIAVIGAGAAGLTAAIFAAKTAPTGASIVLINSTDSIGQKILLSGGGRCNLTNRSVQASDFRGGPAHFIRHALEAFGARETIAFFKECGEKTVQEEDGRVFPVSQSGRRIRDALTHRANKLGVHRVTDFKVENILPRNRQAETYFLVRSKAGQIEARRVILAAGGRSYPQTGSDGSGMRLAHELGHEIVETAPALSPLLGHDDCWRSLSGISLNIRLSFYEGGHRKAQSDGDLLFTHFGFSGPAALDVSRYVSRSGGHGSIRADFIPWVQEEAAALALEKDPIAKRSVKRFMQQQWHLPERVCRVLLGQAGFADQGASDDNKRRIRRLAVSLKQMPLRIRGVMGYDKAEVTSGGAALGQWRVQTMESRLHSGLFAAGEMMDVDGRVGGFNLQWAWTSGFIAGSAAGRSLA